jgi:hypothetical protein
MLADHVPAPAMHHPVDANTPLLPRGTGGLSEATTLCAQVWGSQRPWELGS